MNILITGSSRGIGLEFARRFAERGDRVFATTRTGELPNGLAAIAVKLDVAVPESITAALTTVAAKTHTLDLLINNAGLYSGSNGLASERLGELTIADAHQVLVVNAVGPILIAQAFRDLLLRSRRPKLVSITSGYGSLERNAGGGTLYHYRASKAALNQYMRTFALDPTNRGITTIVMNPGWVRTDMGGPSATLSVEESVKSMIQVIDGLTPERSGQWLDYAGRPHPW